MIKEMQFIMFYLALLIHEMLELTKGIYSGKLLHQSDDSELICCHTAYDPLTFNRERHFHQNAHLSFVLEGNCAERKKESLIRNPGHVTFYHAGEPHQVVGVKNTSRHINIEITPHFLTSNCIREADIADAVSNSPDVKFLMLKMHKELIYNDGDTSSALQSLFITMISREVNYRQYNKNMPYWAIQVEKYLRDHPNHNTTLTELSLIAGAHPVTISKYFTRYFGCTMGEYMRKLKIEQAIAMIKSGQKSLTDVALECGFADQSHFIRTFKNFTGFLPTLYLSL